MRQQSFTNTVVFLAMDSYCKTPWILNSVNLYKQPTRFRSNCDISFNDTCGVTNTRPSHVKNNSAGRKIETTWQCLNVLQFRTWSVFFSGEGARLLTIIFTHLPRRLQPQSFPQGIWSRATALPAFPLDLTCLHNTRCWGLCCQDCRVCCWILMSSTGRDSVFKHSPRSRSSCAGLIGSCNLWWHALQNTCC